MFGAPVEIGEQAGAGEQRLARLGRDPDLESAVRRRGQRSGCQDPAPAELWHPERVPTRCCRGSARVSLA